MDAHAGESDPKWRRLPTWILVTIPALVILGGICALMAYLVTRPPVYRITPSMQQTAAQALGNPGSAPIDLDVHSNAWYPPGRGDYAVQDGMVIFPQEAPAQGPRAYFDTLVIPDKKMPALVFAPNGLAPGTLLPNLNRSWYYLGEWYLDDCRRIDDVAHWWQCALIVGGNI